MSRKLYTTRGRSVPTIAQQPQQQAIYPSVVGPKRHSEGRDGIKRFKVTKGLVRRNGLLNASICRRPELLRIAQRNSTQSPLLRLPAELRNKVWSFALGDHRISIQTLARETSISEVYGIETPCSDFPLGFVKPTFQLPRVCRQIYFEASAYIYTQNTFAFYDVATLDKWIKNRCVGQRRLVTSLDVQYKYTRLYRNGLRKTFRNKFPNIERIGLDNLTLFCNCNEIRRLTENKDRSATITWADAKAKSLQDVRDREGQHSRGVAWSVDVRLSVVVGDLITI